MGCRIEQLHRDTTKHFIFNNNILASAVRAVRGAVLSKIHYLQNIKGSHGNAMGLSDYSVGIIIVESEGHAPVKSGTVQKACTHLLGHCFGRHAEVAAQRIRLLGRSRQSNSSGCSGDPRLERTGRARSWCERRDLQLAERTRRSTWSWSCCRRKRQLRADRRTMWMEGLAHLSSLVNGRIFHVRIETRFLTVASHGTDLPSLVTLMRQDGYTGGTQAMVCVHRAQARRHWQLSHHIVQSVHTHGFVLEPLARFQETGTGALPEIVTRRMQLIQIFLKACDRASVILLEHKLLFLIFILAIVLVILGQFIEAQCHITATAAIGLDQETVFRHRSEALATPATKLQHQLDKNFTLEGNGIFIREHPWII